MQAVRTFLATGIVAQVAIVAALAATIGLSAAGWVVGVACAADHECGTRPRRLADTAPTGWARLIG